MDLQRETAVRNAANRLQWRRPDMCLIHRDLPVVMGSA